MKNGSNENNGFGCAGSCKVRETCIIMSVMKSGHVMPGGGRPFSMLLPLCLPQNPAGGKVWPLANWCIFFFYVKNPFFSTSNRDT